MINAPGYDTYYLLDASDRRSPTCCAGSRSAMPHSPIRDAEVMLHGNRAAFVRTRDGVAAIHLALPVDALSAESVNLS